MKIINISRDDMTFRDINRKEYVIERYFSYEETLDGLSFCRETSVEERKNGATVLKHKLFASQMGLAQLTNIEAKHPDAVIVGTEEQAKAYPGRVLAPIPCAYSCPEVELDGQTHYKDWTFESF